MGPNGWALRAFIQGLGPTNGPYFRAQNPAHLVGWVGLGNGLYGLLRGSNHDGHLMNQALFVRLASYISSSLYVCRNQHFFSLSLVPSSYIKITLTIMNYDKIHHGRTD
ncbi:hypothetical protein VN97_g3523 [Penicillium thymicola]|uniref:Uncharacterized protein n=1 Tax=Penicillium thymicola TaxID=293382 RepID=A0AAI9TMD8_PENTH|nr:hypothetical protein VN97_g3523 [Penicillium thymicola]